MRRFATLFLPVCPNYPVTSAGRAATVHADLAGSNRRWTPQFLCCGCCSWLVEGMWGNWLTAAASSSESGYQGHSIMVGVGSFRLGAPRLIDMLPERGGGQAARPSPCWLLSQTVPPSAACTAGLDRHAYEREGSSWQSRAGVSQTRAKSRQDRYVILKDSWGGGGFGR